MVPAALYHNIRRVFEHQVGFEKFFVNIPALHPVPGHLPDAGRDLFSPTLPDGDNYVHAIPRYLFAVPLMKNKPGNATNLPDCRQELVHIIGSRG